MAGKSVSPTPLLLCTSLIQGLLVSEGNSVMLCGWSLCCCILFSRNHLYIFKNKLLLCGNKMPTRCNRGFYCRSYCLLNVFRASPCPSSGAQEYYTVVAACGILCCGFSSSWSGVELRVMCPVCRMLQHGDARNTLSKQ